MGPCVAASVDMIAVGKSAETACEPTEENSNAMARLHLICHAHLDLVWLWEWEEAAATAITTFRTAADLCEELDEFIL